MSRTPVHEAVIRLQEEGLVRVLTRRGVLICTVSPDDMREIYAVIIALETMAAELLAGQPEVDRAAVVGELTQANETMRQALAHDDLTAWAKADDVFHRTLIDRCGNGRIARIAGTVMDQSHRARMLTLRMRARPVRSFISAYGTSNGTTAASRSAEWPRKPMRASVHYRDTDIR